MCSVPAPNIFLCIPASAADAVAVNPNGIKTFLTNGLVTFFVKGNLVFSNGTESLPKNPPDWIWDNSVFDNLISVDKLFTKALRRLANCLLVSNNSCGKFYHQDYQSYLMIISTSVLFFIADFNLLSCQFDNFTFKLLYWGILYW